MSEQVISKRVEVWVGYSAAMDKYFVHIEAAGAVWRIQLGFISFLEAEHLLRSIVDALVNIGWVERDEKGGATVEV